MKYVILSCLLSAWALAPSQAQYLDPTNVTMPILTGDAPHADAPLKEHRHSEMYDCQGQQDYDPHHSPGNDPHGDKHHVYHKQVPCYVPYGKGHGEENDTHHGANGKSPSSDHRHLSLNRSGHIHSSYGDHSHGTCIDDGEDVEYPPYDPAIIEGWKNAAVYEDNCLTTIRIPNYFSGSPLFVSSDRRGCHKAMEKCEIRLKKFRHNNCGYQKAFCAVLFDNTTR